MTERRYSEDEVREILSLATTGDARDQSQVAESAGLTLYDLKRIGQEVGIDPARIADAASKLDTRGTPTVVRRSFGMPVGMSRVVDVPRSPTDREWEQLISLFRSAFGVPGVATTSGGMRQWSHGNLHVSIEPTERGEQLRLSTLKDDAILFNGLGVLLGGMGILTSAMVVASGKPEKALAAGGMFGGMAVFSFLANVLRLPGWARARQRQLEEVAQHTVKLLSSASDTGNSTT
ncbi:MAG TPA: hypothetical protein VJL35_07805 [Gemmatimonadaceae bacterium]|nr:hypothetical protein [Gemmatimonadaceae bacterium]